VIDDLLQEVFLALVDAVARLRSPEALRPFLYGIALRKTAMELRRRKRKRWLVLLPSHELPDRAEARPSDANPAIDAIRRVLAEVSERQQQAFILRFVEELSPAQVGLALGVSESTAKREILRARERVLKLARLEPVLVNLLARVEEAP
jgi:RNA polymerase sigma-70 factor (ECF subfamily)